MDNPPSPLDTLRQLKEMLDAGALTPTEFEALKQRLVFGNAASPASATPPAAPPDDVPPAPVPYSPTFATVAADEEPAAFTAGLPEPGTVPGESAVPLACSSAPEPLPEPPVPGWPPTRLPEVAPLPARNPLALILSIGGVLAFLAVVLYLTLNRPPSEHISSTSQTAADSLAAPIETGPQVAPLPPSAAVPETVRVVPAHPAPPMQPRPARSWRDSVAAPVPASDSAARQ